MNGVLSWTCLAACLSELLQGDEARRDLHQVHLLSGSGAEGHRQLCGGRLHTASHCFTLLLHAELLQVWEDGREVMVILYLQLMGDWGGGKKLLLFPAHFL